MIRELRAADPVTVGPYQLRGRLGAGGMGQVYLARSPGGRMVAVKVIRPELAEDQEFRVRFAREINAARQVSGAFTAPVIDADAEAEMPWLATVYVPGPSLASAVAEQGPFPVGSVLALAAGLTEGLEAIHRSGLVHRDLKPSNVLLAIDGPRVIDFGLSRLHQGSRLTETGVLMGTPGFLSPEQALGLTAGPPTDVFSLGAVLAFAASGAEPFGDGPVPSLVFRVVHQEPDLTRVPPELRPLVEQCLAKDPDARPTTSDLLKRLSDVTGPLTPEWLPAQVSATLTRYIPTAPGHQPPRPQRTLPQPVLPQPPMAEPAPPPEAARSRPAFQSSATLTRTPGPATGAMPWPSSDQVRPGEASPGFLGYEDGPVPDPVGAEPFLTRWLFTRRLAYLAAAVVVLVALAGGGWYLAVGRYAPVPGVSKLTAAEATAAVEGAGFQVHTGPPVIDANVPKGEVVGTSPSGRALPGATVTLTVSLGPKMITVPQIPATDTVAQAIAALRAAGLTVAPAPKAVGVPSNPKVGTVAGTTPQAGTSVPENEPVTVDEVEGVGLPNLIGQNAQAVQSWATQHDIKLQVAQVADSAAAGTIVAQSPRQGTLIKPGQTPVAVTVSAGPPAIQIPDVAG
jgi:serine/threonine protein kinase/beta-lactam-binding protein with PASTA domain